MERSTGLLEAISGCAVFTATIFAFGCGGQEPGEAVRSSAGQNAIIGASSNLQATAVPTSEIDLAWQASSTQVNGWQVYRSSGGSGPYSLIASLAASARRYANVGLPASSTYCYKLRSWRTTGSTTSYSSYAGPACTATFTPPPPPPPSVAAPSRVTAVPAREDYEAWYNAHVDPSWADNSTNETEFRLEQANDAVGPWTQVTTVPANTTFFHWGVWREQPVCFRVIAANSSATSSPSAPACTTPPANPTNLSALTTDDGIDLAWADNSAVEDGYKVSRADASGLWTDIATLPANATTYSDTAVAKDATYTYRVQALKDGGVSNYSNQVAGVLATTPPATPLDVAANYWFDSFGFWLYFNIWWIDASTNEAGFRIERSDDGASGWTVITSVPADQPYYSDKYSVSWNLTQCFRVIAFNSLGDSPPSEVFCTSYGNPPSDLTASAVDQQAIDLSWTDAARYEVGYDIYRSSSDGSFWVVASLPPDATSYRDSGLVAGQQYCYGVAVRYPAYYDPDDPSNIAYACAATLPSP